MANIGDLPEDVLLELLSLLPVKDLILNCRPVCLQWRDLVDSVTLWKLKLKRKPGSHPGMPRSDAYYIVYHLEKNLIKNLCGEEGMEFWEIPTPQEEVAKGQWKVQEVSGLGKMKLKTTDFLQKNNTVKDKPQHQVNRCFAACNGLCVKSQLITLKDHGYWDQLIDETPLSIVVTDWFFCSPSSQYQLSVKLLSANMEVMDEYSSGNRYSHSWDKGKWREVSHTFFTIPRGIRHILFQHQGQNVGEYKEKDRIRLTKSSVTIIPCISVYDSDDDYDYDYRYDDYGDYSNSSSDEYIDYHSMVHFGCGYGFDSYIW